MGFVERIFTNMETDLAGIAETQFGALAAALGTTGQLLATVVVVLTVINMATQSVRVDVEASIALIFRVALAALFLTSWTQFAAVAYAFRDAFDSIAGVLIAPSGIAAGGGVASEFDVMLADVASAGTAAVGRLDVMGSVMNGIFFLLLTMCGAITAVFLVVSMVMFSMVIALAPLAIVATLWAGSRSYFATWLKAMVTVLLFPVVLAATMGVVIRMVTNAMGGFTTDVETIGGTVPFGMLILLATIMVLLTPYIVNLLTGSLDFARIAARAAPATAMAGAGFARGAAQGAMRGGVAGEGPRAGAGGFERTGAALGGAARDTANYTKSGLNKSEIDEARQRAERMMRRNEAFKKRGY